MSKLAPLPPDDLTIVTMTVAALAVARKAGVLKIHDNGVLTLHVPGQPAVQVFTPALDMRRKFTERAQTPFFAQNQPKMTRTGNMPRQAPTEAAGEGPLAVASATGHEPAANG